MKQVDGTIKTLNIDRTDQERILGVFYDEQMTFLPYLDKIFTSSINNINKIRTQSSLMTTKSKFRNLPFSDFLPFLKFRRSNQYFV